MKYPTGFKAQVAYDLAMFFITGLPRSRTAWTATFLSTIPGVYCHHDALRGCRNLDEYSNRMGDEYENEINGRIVGDCDSALLYCWREVREIFPNARWAVLLRNPRDVQESLIRMKPYRGLTREQWQAGIDSLKEMELELQALRYALEPIEIPVEHLDEPFGMWSLCKAAGVKNLMTIRRYEAMRHMRVNIIPEKMDAELEALRSLLDDVAKRRERLRS